MPVILVHGIVYTNYMYGIQGIIYKYLTNLYSGGGAADSLAPPSPSAVALSLLIGSLESSSAGQRLVLDTKGGESFAKHRRRTPPSADRGTLASQVGTRASTTTSEAGFTALVPNPKSDGDG